MKFSELWLREWINPPVDTLTLIDKITMAGLKVDILEPVSIFFSNVVIGNIIRIKIHPKDCNLKINTIDIGNGSLLNVISTSNQCRKNLRVAVALIGAKLPGNVSIQYSNILGESSEGMLCSFASLGIINDQVNNIIELPIDAPLGQDLKEYLQFNDNIIDVSIPPNRGDCLSVMGISRDISAIYRLPIQIPKIDFIKPNTNDILSVSVDVPDVCPYYFIRILKNIDISISTPLWMRERLRRCGIQLVNVIIDVINYVVLELGQPINVFNLDNICGKISIRWAKNGEILYLSKNKKEVILKSDTLIVADQIRPLGIAGIVVDDLFSLVKVSKIFNIVLESAFFNPLYIIKSVKEYGIFTDSSFRYERYGVNPNVSRLALERVTFFLVKICKGSSGKVVSVTHKNMLPKRIVIVLHRLKLDNLLGYSLENDEIINILINLGCKVKQKKLDNLWNVIVPIWRFDIKVEEDLIEEIIRLHGYDKIPTIPICNELSVIPKSKNLSWLSRSKTLLTDLGYQEVITYSFVDPKMQRLLYPHNKPVILTNPLTLDMSVMRISLWTGLLKTLLYNQTRQQKNIRLFESGKCFMHNKNSIDKIYQCHMLSGITTGTKFDEHWDIKTKMLNFYDIKGDVEALLEINEKLDEIIFKPYVHSALHPGQSAAIFLKEECIGYLGVIHPFLQEKLNLQTCTFVFELLLEKMTQNKIIPKIINVPKFPINCRDISFIVSENISSGKIISECKNIIKNYLADIKLFDVYQGGDIQKGFKSLSIRLYIYHQNRTLQEEEIQLIIKKCISVLKDQFQVVIRTKKMCNIL